MNITKIKKGTRVKYIKEDIALVKDFKGRHIKKNYGKECGIVLNCIYTINKIDVGFFTLLESQKPLFLDATCFEVVGSRTREYPIVKFMRSKYV
jgi:hypothetical protein